MPKIRFIEHNGREHCVDAVVGNTVMRTAVEHFVPGIVGECGGACSCGTCHGYVDPAWLSRIPAKSETETSVLDGIMRTEDNSRLTCQITVTEELNGLVVRLPISQF